MADRLSKMIQRATPYFDLHFACWANNHGGKSKAKQHYKKSCKRKEKRLAQREMEEE